MKKPVSLLCSAFPLLMFPAALHAVDVTFSTASVTHQQGAPYQISGTINNNVVGAGWGVDGGALVAQSAFFTNAAAVSGTEWGFTLHHHAGFADHHINQFRISYTTDAVPSAGGTWNQITPQSFRATNGIALSSIGSNTLQAIGQAGNTAYRVIAGANLSNVTGFRLEVFPFDFSNADALGATLGRGPTNGNFVLSEFEVDTTSTINRALGGVVTATAPTWTGNPASMIVDGSTDSFSHPLNPPGSANGFNYTVDMGDVIALTSIDLRNRSNCCPERLSNYKVEVLDALQNPMWSADVRTDGTNSGQGGLDVLTAASGTGIFAGKYLRISNIGFGPNLYTPQIGEVRAFGVVVPEPGAAALALLGLTALWRRKR